MIKDHSGLDVISVESWKNTIQMLWYNRLHYFAISVSHKLHLIYHRKHACRHGLIMKDMLITSENKYISRYTQNQIYFYFFGVISFLVGIFFRDLFSLECIFFSTNIPQLYSNVLIPLITYRTCSSEWRLARLSTLASWICLDRVHWT